MAADPRHRRRQRRDFPPHIIRVFYHLQARSFFSNSHPGPSGTVKLAKKEPAPKPAAASTKEKKPAAKVHLFA